jgi:hypothetical protein
MVHRYGARNSLEETCQNLTKKGKALAKSDLEKKTSPAPQETSWVTNEETDEAYESSEEHTEDDQGKTQGKVAWQERLRGSI